MPNDHVDVVRRITVIGNHASRRVIGFVEAAHRLGWIVDVSPYSELTAGGSAPPKPGFIRLESPGDCATTTRWILKAGMAPMEATGKIPVCDEQIEKLQFERGAILHPLQWYLGYREILKSLEANWTDPNLRWMSTPQSVITAFDKLACLNLWENAGLPVPFRYPSPATYSQIRKTVTDRHARLFLKLRYGYSAIGAVALEWRDARVRAITTVEVTWSDGRPRLYVSKKPRLLDREFEIAWLIDTLAMEDLLMEDWLPKARWNGLPFDLRVITIGGTVMHAVGRANASPFTNLNLDARRILQSELIDRFGEDWSRVESVCRDAARTLPQAGMLGIDLLVHPDHQTFALLEANAFGDYLPGLTFQGMSTWEAQLRQLCLSHGETP